MTKAIPDPKKHTHIPFKDAKCSLCGAEGVVRGQPTPKVDQEPIDKELLTAAVKKTVEQYGETLRMLGSTDTPKVDQEPKKLKLQKIEWGFDERNIPKEGLVSLSSKHGVVKIIFNDRTAIADGCTRGTLEETIVRLVNKKLEEL